MHGNLAMAREPHDMHARILADVQRKQGGEIREGKLYPLRLVASQELVEQAALDMGICWFAAHTEPRAEFQAEEGLREAGYQTFLPSYLRTVTHARRIRERRMPLFPGYVFVGFNPAKNEWGAIPDVDGVVRLLKASGQPLQVPDRLITMLMVDNLLKAHDEIVSATERDEPIRKKVSKKDKSWKGRKERARERDRRKKAKAMGEWLQKASGER